MPRRNCSSFAKRQFHPKEGEVRIYKTRGNTDRKSGGSVFSCVTNISDAGTYEIEICERQSPDCGSISTRALCSNVSLSSNNSGTFESEKYSTRRGCLGFTEPNPKILSLRMPPSKSKNGLMHSYYPCLCVANPQINDRPVTRVELSDKNTNAVVDTVDRAQSCASVSSVLRPAHKKQSSPATDSENNCSCSNCDSTTSSSSSCPSTKTDNSSDESGSTCRNSDPSSDSSRNNGSRTSRDSPKSGSTVKKSSSSGSDKTPKDECPTKEVKEGKTTVVLELIREEKDKQLLKAGEPSKTCNCEIKNYDERLRKLEKLCFASRTTEDGNKANGECDCTTTIAHFAEIKFRIDELEKMYRDSLEGEKETGGVRLLPENLEEATRTAIELAKIKKRLVDLETKIIKYKDNDDPSVQSAQKVTSSSKNRKSGNITKNRVNQATDESDKEIQVIDFEKERRLNIRPKDSWRYVKDGETTAYSFTKKTNPFRDEAIQTPSRKSVDQWSADSELQVKGRGTKKRFDSKKSCDNMHFCKECYYYINQELDPVRSTSMENHWGNTQPYKNHQEENEKHITRNHNKFGVHQMNNFDSKESRKYFIRRARRSYDKKSKRDYKNLKLSTKCPITNLKEVFASNYESDAEEYPLFITNNEYDKESKSIRYVDVRSKESERNLENVRLPHQSFHIYHCKQTRHSLVFPTPTPSRLDQRSSYRSRRSKASPRDVTPNGYPTYIIRDDEAEMLHECRHRSCDEPSGEFYPVVMRVPDVSDSSDFDRKKRNHLKTSKAGRKVEIPALFEEVCNSGQNKVFAQGSSMSVKIVRVGVDVDAGKNSLNPWRKILRKLSHSQSLDNKVKFSPFGMGGYHPENVKKEKTGDKTKPFNLTSVLKRSWVS